MLKIIIPIILFFTIIKADNVSNILTQIKNAQPSEKRVLINKLKVMLRSENIQTRKQVFNKLKQTHNEHMNNQNHINKINSNHINNFDGKNNFTQKNNIKNKMQVHK